MKAETWREEFDDRFVMNISEGMLKGHRAIRNKPTEIKDFIHKVEQSALQRGRELERKELIQSGWSRATTSNGLTFDEVLRQADKEKFDSPIAVTPPEETNGETTP